MNTKHTPGPWMWRTSNVVLVGLDLDQPIKAKGVAQMLGYREEAEANAHLIAAAPELLAMLIDVRADLACLPRALGYDFTHLPKLDALIAKAKGEQA